MYFWRSRENWALEVMGVDALKTRNAQDNTWSNIPEKKYLCVSWAEPPLAVFRLLSKQSHARSVTFVVILTLISFRQSIYQISCFSLTWLSFENRLVICDRPKCGSAFEKKITEGCSPVLACPSCGRGPRWIQGAAGLVRELFVFIWQK